VTDTIGDRIQDIRDRLGSTRKELSYQGLADEIAEKTGESVSVPALRNYAEGTREPPLRVLAAIAAVDPLQRGVLWLAYGPDAVEEEKYRMREEAARNTKDAPPLPPELMKPAERRENSRRIERA
jgi:transcriptional regulator with XRE-family HTH domain